MRGAPVTTATDYARGDAYLKELAQRTGGRMYRGNSAINISQAFAWVADELRRRYSLRYYPKAAGRGGGRRRLEVQVARFHVVVQARESYIYSQKSGEEKEAGGQSQQPKQADTPPQRLSGAL